VPQSLLSIAIRWHRGDRVVDEGDRIPTIVLPVCMDVANAREGNMRENNKEVIACCRSECRLPRGDRLAGINIVSD
jgi:hypothetical protein